MSELRRVAVFGGEKKKTPQLRKRENRSCVGLGPDAKKKTGRFRLQTRPVCTFQLPFFYACLMPKVNKKISIGELYSRMGATKPLSRKGEKARFLCVQFRFAVFLREPGCPLTAQHL